MDPIRAILKLSKLMFCLSVSEIDPFGVQNQRRDDVPLEELSDSPHPTVDGRNLKSYVTTLKTKTIGLGVIL